MAGFELRGHLLGSESPVVTEMIIVNSATVVVGDAVNVSAGFVQRATAGSKVLGIAAAIVSEKGIDLDNAPAADFDGTWTSSSATYVAAADNQTDKKVKVKIIADPYALFYNDSAGDLANADEKLFLDLVSATQIADANAGSTGQFQLWKRDPDGDADASKGLWRIAEWQGTPYTQD